MNFERLVIFYLVKQYRAVQFNAMVRLTLFNKSLYGSSWKEVQRRAVEKVLISMQPIVRKPCATERRSGLGGAAASSLR